MEDNVGFGLKRSNRAGARSELIDHYIEMVGLTGFEQDLSRASSPAACEQRVEIARALAAEPDMLYMDEPFGALDYLTRLRLRAELMRIWQRERKTVLFVTHDIEEAVQLADRVVVMGKRPSRIRDIVTVDVPRPRDLDNPECRRLRDHIFGVMGLDHSGLATGNAGAGEEEDEEGGKVVQSERPTVSPHHPEGGVPYDGTSADSSPSLPLLQSQIPFHRHADPALETLAVALDLADRLVEEDALDPEEGDEHGRRVPASDRPAGRPGPSSRRSWRR